MNQRVVDAVGPSASTSMTWQLHREMVLLAGWGRAILLQLAHPLVARGVGDHSAFLVERRGRFRRLHRTLSAMLTLTFGTPEEIQGVARTINGIHDRVHGELPAAEGIFPAHARYTAHDPALLGWVHATLVDSFLLTYERFVQPLSPEERDRYCVESSAIEHLLGIPEGTLPRSMQELTAYLEGMLSSGEIHVTDTARALGAEVLNPPVPPVIGRPLVALARLPAVGLLPPSVRREYGLAWDRRHEQALAMLSGVARRIIPRLPSPLRYWPAARAARSR
jgi:uncharacterized protein (DUF2236 family)